MAATMEQLATRTLQKLGVLAANEDPSAADKAKAIEKLRSAFAALDVDGLLRWTEADIPRYAEEPLVMMAAYFAASDFERGADPSWPTQAITLIARGVNLRTTSTVSTEYF